ncbi:unnamed protein product, partial [Discosporangium mesarthrocarpum]
MAPCQLCGYPQGEGKGGACHVCGSSNDTAQSLRLYKGHSLLGSTSAPTINVPRAGTGREIHSDLRALLDLIPQCDTKKKRIRELMSTAGVIPPLEPVVSQDSPEEKPGATFILLRPDPAMHALKVMIGPQGARGSQGSKSGSANIFDIMYRGASDSHRQRRRSSRGSFGPSGQASGRDALLRMGSGSTLPKPTSGRLRSCSSSSIGGNGGSSSSSSSSSRM